MAKHFYQVAGTTEEHTSLSDAMKVQSRIAHETSIRPQIIEHFEDGTSVPMPLERPKHFIGTAADEPERRAAEEWYQ